MGKDTETDKKLDRSQDMDTHTVIGILTDTDIRIAIITIIIMVMCTMAILMDILEIMDTERMITVTSMMEKEMKNIMDMNMK